MVKYAAAHLVCRRLDNFEETARRLEHAAQDITSATLDQTLPALPPAMFIFNGAGCTNIRDLTLRSVPMREITEEHILAVRFDRLVQLRIYYILGNGATACTFLLLPAMPNLKHLGIGGFSPEQLDPEQDGDFPDLPFALESFRYSGGVSILGAAHILSESWRHGTLKKLSLFMYTRPLALDTILSAAPASLRTLALSVGRYNEEHERQPLVEAASYFLQQSQGIRHLRLDLCPGISLAGLLGDLRSDSESRLVSLHLKDPSLMDAEWLVENITASRALASLRTLYLEYEVDEEGVPLVDSTVTTELLRSTCRQHRLLLREIDPMM